MKRAWFVLAFVSPLLILGTVVGQDETKKPERNPREVDVHFANGSTVRMTLQTESIDVQTPYGKLTVPVRDIKQIDFGVHLPEGLDQKVDEAIRKLGSENFKERDAATNELIRYGADAYPAVLHASQHSTEIEIAKRAKSVVETMKTNLPAKDLRTQHPDIIVTPTFTLVGRILTPSLKANADYFGDVQVQITKLRMLRSTGAPTEYTVTVDSAKYAAVGGREWLATEYQVEAKTKLSFTATGTVDLWPQQAGGNYISTPNGYATGAAAAIIAKGAVRTRILPGALVGKIGEDGAPFVIGDAHELVAPREGKLYLQIGPSPWSQQCSGSYQVKVTSKY